MSKCVVYWLYDDTCGDPRWHGYVGVSSRLERRLIRHRHVNKFSAFEIAILFRGSIDECHTVELALRPEHGIGWNVVKGGRSGAAFAGMPKPVAQRQKMSETALARGGHFKGPHTSEASAKMKAKTYKAKGLAHPAIGRQWSPEERTKLTPKRRAVIYRGSPTVLTQQESREARQDFKSLQRALSRRRTQNGRMKHFGDSSWVLGV